MLIQEIDGDPMPVSVYLRMDDFTNHEIQLEKGDKLYLFSDGYFDQFGGVKGERYMYGNFKKIIAETSHLSLQEQGIKLEEELEKWVNYNGKHHEQIDDISVLGLMI